MGIARGMGTCAGKPGVSEGIQSRGRAAKAGGEVAGTRWELREGCTRAGKRGVREGMLVLWLCSGGRG